MSLTNGTPGITFSQNVTPRPMTTTVTSKGQVTLPKAIREAAGIKPGDKVDISATASGGIYIEKPGTLRAYDARLNALANRRPVRDGMTTDEFMEFSRGESVAPRRRRK
jgi:antitoxin PrlF